MRCWPPSTDTKLPQGPGCGVGRSAEDRGPSRHPASRPGTLPGADGTKSIEGMAPPGASTVVSFMRSVRRMPEYRRLSWPEDLAELRRLHRDGLTQVAIAERLGCRQCTVSRWLARLDDTRALAKAYVRSHRGRSNAARSRRTSRRVGTDAEGGGFDRHGDGLQDGNRLKTGSVGRFGRERSAASIGEIEL